MRILFASVLLGLIILPSTIARAETVVRTENASIRADQVVAGDYYAYGNAVSVSGTVEGDMYVVALTVTANGTIASDLVALANNVQVHAPVEDDVRAVAGEVVIADRVGGDVYVFAGTLKVLSTATIAGNVYFYGESAIIEGTVEGSVKGTYGTLRLNAQVGQDVNVNIGENLTLGERALVTGDVSYESSNPLMRAQEAVVEGEILQNTPALNSNSYVARSILIPFLVSLFGSLTVYLLFRRHMLRFVQYHTTPVPLRALIGLIALFALPLIGIMLMVTVLGLWLGISVLLLCGALIAVSYLLVPVVVGSAAYALVTKTVVVNTLTVLIGAVLVHAVLYIPVVGTVAVLVALCVVVGAIMTALYHVAR